MKPANDKPLEPTEQTARIVELAEELQAMLGPTRRAIARSGDLAIRIGTLLIAERNRVVKERGRGHWEGYFDRHFAKALQIRTAQRYIGLALGAGQGGKTQLQDDIVVSASRTAPTSEPGELPESAKRDNTLRLVITALEIMPKKVELQIEGNKVTPRLVSHLVVVNRFKAWLTSVRKAKDYEPFTKAQLEQLRKDFRPLIEFCKELEA